MSDDEIFEKCVLKYSSVHFDNFQHLVMKMIFRNGTIQTEDIELLMKKAPKNKRSLDKEILPPLNVLIDKFKFVEMFEDPNDPTRSRRVWGLNQNILSTFKTLLEETLKKCQEDRAQGNFWNCENCGKKFDEDQIKKNASIQYKKKEYDKIICLDPGCNNDKVILNFQKQNKNEEQNNNEQIQEYKKLIIEIQNDFLKVYKTYKDSKTQNKNFLDKYNAKLFNKKNESDEEEEQYKKSIFKQPLTKQFVQEMVEIKKIDPQIFKQEEQKIGLSNDEKKNKLSYDYIKDSILSQNNQKEQNQTTKK